MCSVCTCWLLLCLLENTRVEVQANVCAWWKEMEVRIVVEVVLTYSGVRGGVVVVVVAEEWVVVRAERESEVVCVCEREKEGRKGV